jgi:hypothetical protein
LRHVSALLEQGKRHWVYIDFSTALKGANLIRGVKAVPKLHLMGTIEILLHPQFGVTIALGQSDGLNALYRSSIFARRLSMPVVGHNPAERKY